MVEQRFNADSKGSTMPLTFNSLCSLTSPYRFLTTDTPVSHTPQSITPQREPSPLPSPAPPMQQPAAPSGGGEKEDRAPCEYENILLIKVTLLYYISFPFKIFLSILSLL